MWSSFMRRTWRRGRSWVLRRPSGYSSARSYFSMQGQAILLKGASARFQLLPPSTLLSGSIRALLAQAAVVSSAACRIFSASMAPCSSGANPLPRRSARRSPRDGRAPWRAASPRSRGQLPHTNVGLPVRLDLSRVQEYVSKSTMPASASSSTTLVNTCSKFRPYARGAEPVRVFVLQQAHASHHSRLTSSRVACAIFATG